MTYGEIIDRFDEMLGRDSAKWLDPYRLDVDAMYRCRGVDAEEKPRELKAAYCDEDSGLTVAVFSDGSKRFIRCDEKDEFDKRIAIALALAYDRFGSKRKFHEFADKVAKPVKKKEKKTAKKEEKNVDQG